MVIPQLEEAEKVYLPNTETSPRAIILAASRGSELGELTNDIPKAMVEVKGKPLLQWAIEKLIASGCQDIIINVHHFADMIII